MKYRLKDQELQAKLDELSGGDFSKRLEEVDPNINAPKSGGGIYVSFGKIQFGAGFSDGQGHFRQYQIAILYKDLIIEKTYDPRSWNPFPEVTPPEGVLMRVEFIWNDGSPGRCCGKLWNGVWVSSDDLNLEIECVKRFRPWEDEE